MTNPNDPTADAFHAVLLTPADAQRIERIAEYYAHHDGIMWRRGSKPCMKSGPEDRDGFAMSCMRPSGHTGACDGHAAINRCNAESDVVFLLRVLTKVLA